MKMRTKLRASVRFAAILLVILSLLLALHVLILDLSGNPPWDNLILQAYLANWGIASLLFFVLFALKDHVSGNLVYIFLFGSLLKAIVFLSLFRPAYMVNDVVSKTEFLTFFLPLMVSLVVEVILLSKRINEQENF